jgi:hypothetical protein
MAKKIKQKHYHDLKVDNREKNIVQIWGLGKHMWGKGSNTEVIQIERRNIPTLIEALKKCG